MGWSVVAGAGRWDGRDGLKDRLATKLRAAVPDRTSGRNGGTTRPVCSDCRLMPTIETVVLKRLLLEQIAEQGDGQ